MNAAPSNQDDDDPKDIAALGDRIEELCKMAYLQYDPDAEDILREVAHGLPRHLAHLIAGQFNFGIDPASGVACISPSCASAWDCLCDQRTGSVVGAVFPGAFEIMPSVYKFSGYDSPQAIADTARELGFSYCHSMETFASEIDA